MYSNYLVNNKKKLKMKNYYTNLTGSKLYKRILFNYNELLDKYQKNNSDNNLYKLVNLAILGSLLDLYGGKPPHYDTIQNRKKRLVEGLKLFDDNVFISNVPENFYKLKKEIDNEGTKENQLVTLLALNNNENDEDYGDIFYLGNWENPIGSNQNCLRELLSGIRKKKIKDIETANMINNSYENVNNLNTENTVMNYDDDYYSETNFNLYSFHEDIFKKINNYILIIVNGISNREDSEIGQFINGNIYVDKYFFRNIENNKYFFRPQYYTHERGITKDQFFVYKYT